MKSTWGSRTGFVALIGGLLLARSDLGVPPAAATPAKESPFAGVTQNWDKNLLSASQIVRRLIRKFLHSQKDR